MCSGARCYWPHFDVQLILLLGNFISFFIMQFWHFLGRSKNFILKDCFIIIINSLLVMLMAQRTVSAVAFILTFLEGSHIHCCCLSYSWNYSGLALCRSYQHQCITINRTKCTRNLMLMLIYVVLHPSRQFRALPCSFRILDQVKIYSYDILSSKAYDGISMWQSTQIGAQPLFWKHESFWDDLTWMFMWKVLPVKRVMKIAVVLWFVCWRDCSAVHVAGPTPYRRPFSTKRDLPFRWPQKVSDGRIRGHGGRSEFAPALYEVLFSKDPVWSS